MAPGSKICRASWVGGMRYSVWAVNHSDTSQSWASARSGMRKRVDGESDLDNRKGLEETEASVCFSPSSSSSFFFKVDRWQNVKRRSHMTSLNSTSALEIIKIYLIVLL